MQSKPHRTRFLLIAASLVVASSCANRVVIQPQFPPAPDIKAAIQPKPVPGVDILTSEVAAEKHDIAVETWGESISRAGSRICRWVKDNGGALPFECPPQ